MKQNEYGFSLIELIVVIAIIGVISAALIPNYVTMALRSRMRVDISSVRILQEQIEIYEQQHEAWPGSNITDIVSTLLKEDYLSPRYVDVPNSRIRLETSGASVIFDVDSKQAKLLVTDEQYAIYQDGLEKDKWLSH